MPMRPTISKDEHARLGDALYDEYIKPLVEPEQIGRFAAIDIQTGPFEIGDSVLDATSALYARIPDALPSLVRIGYRALWHRGGHSRAIRPRYLVS